MARPIKNSVDYFSHDANMRNHRKVKAIRNKFGLIGYGLWALILEYMAGIDGNVFEYSDLEFELMAGDFGVSAAEIRDVVDYCITLEMLFNVNGFIQSPSLDERLEAVYKKRGKAKELSKKQQRKNGKFCNNNTESTVVPVTETPQSKVKESKENTHTAENICKIFGKEYKAPDNRMRAEANFYSTIDEQATTLLTVLTPPVAAAQIDAYVRYCRKSERQLIGKAYKACETILSADWIQLLGEPPPQDPFKEPAFDRANMTREAWEKQYAFLLRNNQDFRIHFGYEKLPSGKTVGINGAS